MIWPEIQLPPSTQRKSKDRRVIKNIQKLMCLLLLLYGNSASAGVDCTESPHTRLEIAICGEPVLHAIDQELTDALTRAQRRGIIDRTDVREQRNQIARQCWREAEESLNSCVHRAELQALEWVAVELGEFEGENAEKNRVLRERLREGLVHQKFLLQKQLELAESTMRRTGNPDLTVVTIFELIRINERQQHLRISGDRAGGAIEDRTTEDRTGEGRAIAQLELRLAAGCSHSVYGSKWRKMVERREMSCDKIKHPQGELYSSYKFD